MNVSAVSIVPAEKLKLIQPITLQHAWPYPRWSTADCSCVSTNHVVQIDVWMIHAHGQDSI